MPNPYEPSSELEEVKTLEPDSRPTIVSLASATFAIAGIATLIFGDLFGGLGALLMALCLRTVNHWTIDDNDEPIG